MYVCVCNGVKERDIHEAVDGGARTYDQLQAMTGCGTGCGCCEPEAIQVMEQRLREQETTRAPLAPPTFNTLAFGSGR